MPHKTSLKDDSPAKPNSLKSRVSTEHERRINKLIQVAKRKVNQAYEIELNSRLKIIEFMLGSVSVEYYAYAVSKCECIRHLNLREELSRIGLPVLDQNRCLINDKEARRASHSFTPNIIRSIDEMLYDKEYNFFVARSSVILEYVPTKEIIPASPCVLVK